VPATAVKSLVRIAFSAATRTEFVIIN